MIQTVGKLHYFDMDSEYKDYRFDTKNLFRGKNKIRNDNFFFRIKLPEYPVLQEQLKAVIVLDETTIFVHVALF